MAPLLAAGAIEGVGKSKILQWTIAGIVILAVIPTFLIVKKLLQRLQIIDTPEERKAKKGIEDIEADNKLNPNYWRTLSSKEREKLIDRKQALANIGKTLRKELQSLLQEDEEAIIGAIRMIKTKAEFSFLAELYLRNTNTDLMADLQRSLYGFLDQNLFGEKDLQRIITHLRNLPNK